MKLATEIPWQSRHFRMPVERIRLSERLGFDALFSSEGWGTDGLTPLGYAAALTSRLALGTSVTQVTARSPAATAMAMQTLAAMTGGDRVLLGLGSTRPYVTEGLHGRRWGDPVARMRDFVAVVRNAFEGYSLAHEGREISIPYRGKGSTGADAMRLLLEPTPLIPIYVAASGTTMITTAAEIADGWLPRSFAPGMLDHAMPLLAEGFSRAGNGKSIQDFEIWAHVDAMVDDNVRAAMRHFKEYVARWAGSQRQQMAWCGHAETCDRVEELMAAGCVEEAVNAVPDDYIDQAWLVGPLGRIKRRLEPWLDSGATGLIIRQGGPQPGLDAPAENLDLYRAVADVVK